MKIKRRRMEEDVKNTKIKLKDMERHDDPSFPLDIVVFYLILYHTPNSTTLSTFIIIIYIHFDSCKQDGKLDRATGRRAYPYN